MAAEELSRVAVAMSGGADSTAAAALLARSGQDALGVTMKLWDCAVVAALPGGAGLCCSPRDAADAARSAARIGIEHVLLDMADEFLHLVVAPFCREYAAGRTPSPCVGCNRLVKFGALAERVRPAGCGMIATGHYARLETLPGGRTGLLRGVSAEHDQSYFLAGLRPEQLGRTLLPVGALRREEVREIVAGLDLAVAEKPSSQEFCFAPDGDYSRVLARYAPEALEPGPLLDSSGKTLGEHAGIGRYTVGQRRGLGVATGRPLYVVRIEAPTRTVVVGEDAELLAAGLVAAEVNWIADPPQAGTRCTVRVRHGGREAPAALTAQPGGGAEVRFDEPVRAVAPGQWACFYDGQRVLGGGTIERALQLRESER